MCYHNALTTGRNWHAVTVGEGGKVYVHTATAPCQSEAEFHGKPPPPVTVWSTRGDSFPSLTEDEINHEMDWFDPADQFYMLGGVKGLVRKLEQAGFTVRT